MAPLPGAHKVRVTLANSRAEYWYAWRGGPRILSESAPTDKALDQRVARAAADASRLYHEHIAKRGPNAEGFVAGLIYAWQESPAFAQYAPRSQKDLRKHLSAIHEKYGALPVKAMGSVGFHRDVIDWRDSMAATPCTADQLVSTIQTMMKWGKEAGHGTPEFGEWRRLYKVDRSAIVWEPDEIEALCAAASPELQRAILLAAYTGLRQGDLLRLTWADVGKDTLTRFTNKRRRTVHIPLTPEVQAVLDSCPKIGPVVLTDRPERPDKDNPKPWNPSTLAKHFALARAAAAEARKDPALKLKRWHDLRGTYATLLVRAGVTSEGLARIMGWSKETADEIQTRYVGGRAVALAALERLKRFTANGQPIDSTGGEN